MAARFSHSRGRVLVTGLGGFTGRYIGASLRAKGYTVLGADTRGRSLDLRYPVGFDAALAELRPDYVLHLAAISFVAASDATDFYGVNTIGTAALLEALGRYPGTLRKVILASSANVYGNATDDPITESTPAEPVNHYGCSKLAMEHLAKTWFDRLPIIVTRPFNYTGPGQAPQFLVPKIVSHAARGVLQIELGNLDVVRDFSDVRDVAETYVRLLEVESHSLIVNISSGRGHSLREVLDNMAAIAGYRLHVQVNPKLVRAHEVHRLVGSRDLLERIVGTAPTFDFTETLRWMFDDHRDRHT